VKDWRRRISAERRKAGAGEGGIVEPPDQRGYNALMDLPAGFPRSPKPPKSFNRSELVRALYEHFGANGGEEQGPRLRRREEAERLVSCLLEEIASALERGMRVELRGLGALNVRAKRERQGRNPRTGEALTIDARRIVRFRATELLLTRLTGGRTHGRNALSRIRASWLSRLRTRRKSAPIWKPPSSRRDWLAAGKPEGKGAAYEKGD
jgi:integration host factor subunit beta